MTLAQLRVQAWSDTDIGLLLGAFYVGYAVSQVPASLLAIRFGCARVLGVCIGFWDVIQFVFPFAESSLVGLCVLRVLTGVLYGSLVPCSFSLVSHWSPGSEKTRFSSFVASGREVGMIVSLCLTPVLKVVSWKWLFWGNAVEVAAVFPFFVVFVASTPELSRWLKPEEREFILSNRPPLASASFWDVPWRKTFTSKAIYGLFFTLASVDALLLILTGLLPTFFTLQGVGVQVVGFYCIPPFVAMAVGGLATSILADYLANQRGWRVLKVRRFFQTISFASGIVFCAIVGVIGLERFHPMVFSAILSVTMLLWASFRSGVWTNIQDVGGLYSGHLMSVANSLAMIFPMIGPPLIGLWVENHDWRLIFFLMGANCLLGLIVFLVSSTDQVLLESPSPQYAEIVLEEESEQTL